jgi:hypothetical protein
MRFKFTVASVALSPLSPCRLCHLVASVAWVGPTLFFILPRAGWMKTRNMMMMIDQVKIRKRDLAKIRGGRRWATEATEATKRQGDQEETWQSVTFDTTSPPLQHASAQQGKCVTNADGRKTIAHLITPITLITLMTLIWLQQTPSVCCDTVHACTKLLIVH